MLRGGGEGGGLLGKSGLGKKSVQTPRSPHPETYGRTLVHGVRVRMSVAERERETGEEAEIGGEREGE